MAVLCEDSRPVNESERATVARLVAALPDSYVVVPNALIADPQRGNPLEADIVVCAPHAVYVVEVKGWRGHIATLNHQKWQINHHDVRPNPLAANGHKARVLSGLLKNVPGLPARQTPFVESCVVLTSPTAELDLNAPHRRRTFRPAELIAFLQDADATDSRFQNDWSQHVHAIANFIRGADAAGEPNRVFGEFEVFEELERTEDGIIGLARHRLLDDGRLWRIRTWHVSPYLLTHEQQEHKTTVLKRSAESLSRIGAHRNIAELGGLGDDGEGTFFEATEWSPTGSLADAISRGLSGRLSFDDKLDLLIGVCDGAQAAADAGVFHRDLSAASVLIAADGTPRVTGFDRAFIEDSSATVYGDVAPRQVDLTRAPELCGDEPEVFDSTDVYGIGVVAFDLLTGEWPSKVPDDPDGYRWALPSERCALPPDAAQAVDELVIGCLSPDPADRPATPGHVSRSLHAIRNAGGAGDAAAGTTPPRDSGDAAEPAATPDTAPPSIGDRIGRNEIEHVIARGAAATVYRVRNDVLLGHFALKLAHADADDPQRPIREFQLMRRVEHPGVVRAIAADDHPQIPGCAYALLALVEGPTLTDVLATLGEPSAITLPERVALLAALADAVHAVHEAGVVHCDVKGDNVIVSEQGPVLIDFGAASLVERAGSAPTATQRYTPPDLAEAGWTAAADVFALGCLGRELLCGGHPWGDGTPVADILPEPCAGIDPGLATVVEHAYRPLARERTQTAAQFAEQLRAAIASESAATGPDARARTDADTIAAAPADRVPLAVDPGAHSANLVEVDRATRVPEPAPRAPTADDAHAVPPRPANPVTRAVRRAVTQRVPPTPPTPTLASAGGVLGAGQLRALVEADDAVPVFAAAFHTLFSQHTASDVASILQAEARATRLETLLTQVAPEAYLSLADSRSPWGCSEPDDAAVLQVAHVHPCVVHTVVDVVTERQRMVVQGWHTPPLAAVVPEATSAPARPDSDVPSDTVSLPLGYRDRGGLAALFAERSELLRRRLADHLDAHPGPVFVRATSGACYLGSGLGVDVTSGLDAQTADRARRSWATTFGGARTAARLPDDPRAATDTDLVPRASKRGDAVFAVGRIVWPAPPDAPRLSAGGVSIAERVLPVFSIGPAPPTRS